MDKYPVRIIVVFSAIVSFSLACQLPVFATPDSPNAESVPIETIIAGTAAAAQTQTAVFLPPATQTETMPPLPTATVTETLTPTATVIFIIPSATEPFVPGSAGRGCDLVAITPYNPIVDPNESFDTTWTIKNTGSDLWLNNNVDFKYSSGTDMHKTDIYDLPKSIPPKVEIDLTVPMIAPGKSGAYTTTWVLSTNKQTLCKVSAMVIVR